MAAPQQQSLAASFAQPYLNRSSTPQQSLATYRIKDGNGSKLINLPYTAEPPKGAICVGLLMGLDTVRLCNDPTDKGAPTYIQRARFYSDKLVIYPQRLESTALPQPRERSMANLSRGHYNGYISKNSGQLIRKRLEAWIKAVAQERDRCSASFRPKHSHIVFLTLTLPADQVHSDNEIKRKCLMPFIQQLKRAHGVDQYFWSAEPQENGNIHFHVLVDRFIDKSRLRDQWNSSINLLGYHDRFVQSSRQVSAPSTRINECPPKMSLVKYVLKYVTKQPEIRSSLRMVDGARLKRVSFWQSEEVNGGVIGARQLGYDLSEDRFTIKGGKVFRWYERRRIEGRSWGMSEGLQKLDVYSAPVTYRIQDLQTVLEWDGSVKMLKRDYAEVYYCNVVDQMLRNEPALLSDYRAYYVQLYDQLYRPQAKKEAKVIELPKVVERAQVNDPPRLLQLSLMA